jgi:hypothetical protein
LTTIPDLSPATQAAFVAYRPKRPTAPNSAERSAQLSDATDAVEAAWRAAEAAGAEEGTFVDLPLARRLRAALTAALSAAMPFPPHLSDLLIAAARYFADADDVDGDLNNAWGFDDDRAVVDEVITTLNLHAGTTLKRSGNVLRPPRPSRAGQPPGRKLPRVDDGVRDLLFLQPADVAEALLHSAELCVDDARRDGVDPTVQDLRARIHAHVEVAQTARDDRGVVDVSAARAIAAALDALLTTHAVASPFNDRVLPLVLAAGERFVTTDDDSDDLRDPFGFDDERAFVVAVIAVIRALGGPRDANPSTSAGSMA